MRSEDEIREYKNKIEQELALKIARACVGYRENVKATSERNFGMFRPFVNGGV